MRPSLQGTWLKDAASSDLQAGTGGFCSPWRIEQGESGLVDFQPAARSVCTPPLTALPAKPAALRFSLPPQAMSRAMDAMRIGGIQASGHDCFGWLALARTRS